jgi:hypothetical protein
MTDDYTIRVDAGDLADIIADRQSARADLETCIRDATEGAAQRDETINDLLVQFNRFRRAVQEALGFDQPELLHDNELIKLVRDANERARKGQLITLQDASVEIDGVFAGRRDVSWTPPQYADFQRTGFAKQHDADDAAEHAMARPTMTTTVPGPWALGDLIEHTGTHGGVYVAKLVEPDEADWWRAIVVEVVRSPEDTAGVFVEQSIRLLENGTGNNRRIWAAPVESTVEQIERQIAPVVNEIEEYDRQMTAAGITPKPVKTRADRAREQAEQDGPPTESMPPVQDPPEAPAGYEIGRVFTRGDTCPAELDMVVNRSGDVMRVFAETGAWCVLRQDATVVSWSEQLHINGLLWELVPVAEQHAAEPETAADHGE